MYTLLLYAVSFLIANLDAEAVDDLNQKFGVTLTLEQWEKKLEENLKLV